MKRRTSRGAAGAVTTAADSKLKLPPTPHAATELPFHQWRRPQARRRRVLPLPCGWYVARPGKLPGGALRGRLLAAEREHASRARLRGAGETEVGHGDQRSAGDPRAVRPRAYSRWDALWRRFLSQSFRARTQSGRRRELSRIDAALGDWRPISWQSLTTIWRNGRRKRHARLASRRSWQKN